MSSAKVLASLVELLTRVQPHADPPQRVRDWIDEDEALTTARARCLVYREDLGKGLLNAVWPSTHTHYPEERSRDLAAERELEQRWAGVIHGIRARSERKQALDLLTERIAAELEPFASKETEANEAIRKQSTTDKNRKRVAHGTGRDLVPPEECQLRHWKLLKIVGRLPHGTLFKARDVRTGEIVTCMIYKAKFVSTSQYREQIEAGTKFLKANAARLHGIVPIVVPFDTQGKIGFVVRKYIHDAKTLERLVEERGCLPIELAVKVIAAPARALGRVHGQCSKHGKVRPARDLSAANILIEGDGSDRAWIADLDCLFVEGEEALAAEGFDKYNAPEYFEHDAITAAADVYALAVCFVYAVTGVVRGPHKLSGTEWLESLPEPFRPVLRKALLEPARTRQPDGTAFADELEQALTAFLGLRNSVHSELREFVRGAVESEERLRHPHEPRLSFGDAGIRAIQGSWAELRERARSCRADETLIAEAARAAHHWMAAGYALDGNLRAAFAEAERLCATDAGAARRLVGAIFEYRLLPLLAAGQDRFESWANALDSLAALLPGDAEARLAEAYEASWVQDVKRVRWTPPIHMVRFVERLPSTDRTREDYRQMYSVELRAAIVAHAGEGRLPWRGMKAFKRMFPADVESHGLGVLEELRNRIRQLESDPPRPTLRWELWNTQRVAFELAATLPEAAAERSLNRLLLAYCDRDDGLDRLLFSDAAPLLRAWAAGDRDEIRRATLAADLRGCILNRLPCQRNVPFRCLGPLRRVLEVARGIGLIDPRWLDELRSFYEPSIASEMDTAWLALAELERFVHPARSIELWKRVRTAHQGATVEERLVASWCLQSIDRFERWSRPKAATAATSGGAQPILR